MTNPFDFVNDIINKKEYIFNDENQKEYIPFIVNRALSYYPEAIFYAQDMNIYSNLDKKLQYHYLINTIRPTKIQYKKWGKKTEDNDIAILQEYFNYSYNEAKMALSVLSDVQIKTIRKKLDKGGLK